MKTITSKELRRRQVELKRVQDLGIKLINKKNIYKIVLGSCLAGLGVVTLPIPTGSVVLIAVGLSLIANGGVDILGYKHDLKIWFSIKSKELLWKK